MRADFWEILLQGIGFYEGKVMVDKNYNIITTEELCKRFWCFIKENTTQIAIAIPIITAIYASVSDYYFYIVSCGYYKYFRIDGVVV